MKYSAKRRWAIDIDIVADHSGLCCAQVIWCVRELYKAISANGNDCGIAPHIGDEHFHTIEFWCGAGADLPTLFQLVSEMSREGCYIETFSGDRKKDERLANLDYQLRHCND